MPFKKIVAALLICILGCYFTSLYNLSRADQSINETASVTIPPSSSDFQFSFTSTDSTQTDIPQDTTLSYLITYGAKQSAGLSTTDTITVNYSQDLSSDNSDLLSYVVGSATNGYNGSQPVIDTVNKTITWTISNLPNGTTDQSVTFQLKTTSNYTGSTAQPFTITASMSNTYVTLPTQSVNQSYLYNSNVITPTITPTSAPGPTSTPSPTTPTPTPTPAPFEITSVVINSISDKDTVITTTTNDLADIILSFGKSRENLSQTVNSSAYSKQTTLHLTKLEPSTKYFFQITAIDTQNHQVISELFTFQTAKISQPTQVLTKSIVISGGGNIISSPSFAQTPFPQAVIPFNKDYQVNFKLDHSVRIKRINVILRSEHVLGFFSGETEAQLEKQMPYAEIQPGVFLVNLTTPNLPDLYELYVHLEDTNGNIVEQKIAEITVGNPLKTVDSITQAPIENARILLYSFNPSTRTYTLFPQSLTFANPFFTDTYGQNAVVLPLGQYKLAVSAIGYAQQSKIFYLAKNKTYPTIYLTQTPFNLLTTISYYTTVSFDFLNRANIFFFSLSQSNRLFQLMAAGIVFVFILLTFALFLFKTHMSLKSFFAFIIHKTNRLFNNSSSPYISVQILDDITKLPLLKSQVYLINPQTKVVLEEMHTNSQGQFFAKRSLLNGKNIFEVFHPLYKSKTVFLQENFDSHYLVLLQREIKPKDTRQEIKILSFEFFGMFFETMLVVSFILEMFFGLSFGFIKSLPFIFLSFINLILWMEVRK